MRTQDVRKETRGHLRGEEPSAEQQWGHLRREGQAARLLKALLGWTHRMDVASQAGWQNLRHNSRLHPSCKAGLQPVTGWWVHSTWYAERQGLKCPGCDWQEWRTGEWWWSDCRCGWLRCCWGIWVTASRLWPGYSVETCHLCGTTAFLLLCVL